MLLLRVLEANLRKDLLDMKRYLPNTLSELATFYIIFLMVFLGLSLFGSPKGFGHDVRVIIVGYVVWFLILLVTSNVAWEVSHEAGQGTLEQLCVSPVPLWIIMMARMISAVSVNFLSLCALLVAAMITTGQWLHIDASTTLLVLAGTLWGAVGIGFVLAGLALMYKQVDSLLSILQFVIMGLAFAPSHLTASYWYLPLVQGIALIRQSMIAGMPVNHMAPQELLLLGANSAVYFTIGLIVFSASDRRARRKALLGHY